MDDYAEELGAVAVAGEVKYELVAHDSTHVTLRNILEPDQTINLDLEALPAIANILNRAVGKSSG